MNTITQKSNEKKGIRMIPFLLSVWILLHLTTAGFAQIDGSPSFEGAGIIPSGNVEFTADYSSYSFFYDGESVKLFNDIGVRAGFPVNKNFDIKIGWNKFYDKYEFVDYNSFTISPKIATNTGPIVIGLKMPFSIVLNKFKSDYEEELISMYILNPSLLVSVPVAKWAEVTVSPMGSLYFFKGEKPLGLLGLNLDLGFSSNLEKWAVRPEAGLVFHPKDDGFCWNLGIGLTYRLDVIRSGKTRR
jgi:hypothetical protein